MITQSVKNELKRHASSKKARILQGFFKTKKGEYGEGDNFLGIVVPDIRKIVKKFKNLPLPSIQKLLSSQYHEERLTGLLILVDQFETGDNQQKIKIYNFYLKNLKSVNNWDLVDLTAPKIMGSYLYQRNRKILFKLAQSKNLWSRRIAIMATFYFIRQNDFKDALTLCQKLLNDRQDLIHKAVGWMLREIGNRSIKIEVAFLKKYSQKMPRTMLRYAIEKFPNKLRLKYFKM